MNIKKEIQDIRHASAHQKRLKEKYPQIDGESSKNFKTSKADISPGTPIHILEEIERLQNEYGMW